MAAAVWKKNFLTLAVFKIADLSVDAVFFAQHARHIDVIVQKPGAVALIIRSDQAAEAHLVIPDPLSCHRVDTAAQLTGFSGAPGKIDVVHNHLS